MFEVWDCDRQESADMLLENGLFLRSFAERVREGKHDDLSIVQSYARHRILATQHLATTRALLVADLAAVEADNAQLRATMERCATIVDRNLYHQHEKIEDVPNLLRNALNPTSTRRTSA